MSEDQSVPLTDEELGKIAYLAACEVVEKDSPGWYDPADWDACRPVDREAHIAAARAVREALGQ